MNAEHLKAGRGRGYCGTLTFSGLAETVIWRLPAWTPTFQEEKYAGEIGRVEMKRRQSFWSLLRKGRDF